MARIILIFKKVVRYVPHLPAVILHIKNPLTFLRGYFSFGQRTIFFRNGLKVHTDNPDDISSVSTILIKDEYDLRSVRADAARVIVDIGANKGYFTVLAAKNPSHQVFSYEPIPETFTLLEQNVALNKLSNVRCFNLGVAGDSKEHEFSFSTDKSILSSMVFTPGDETVTIPCTSLGNILTDNKIEKIDLLKLDCEGAEFEILYNSSDDTLSRIKSIRMEYHNAPANAHDTIAELDKFLAEKGFRQTFFEAANDMIGIAWFDRN